MTENERKNGQMNVQIMKSQEKMGKVHSYHDTWLRALNIFCMKFSADHWPRYRSVVIKSLNPYSFLVFQRKLDDIE